MTPDFALFLSPDGIALAHRQPAGHWAVLADTALDVPDLPAALAVLREKGVERAGEGFATLIILPDDQILFTSLTAPGPDDDDRLDQIRSGLDGLTPYSINDLSFDFFPLEDGRVKLAVAARETLAEAEAFARNNGFEPAGFAARPLDNRFPGVAHFDRTPDWTSTISDIEFGHDAWHKAKKPDESAPDTPAEDVPDTADDAGIGAGDADISTKADPEGNAGGTPDTNPDQDDTNTDADTGTDAPAADIEPEQRPKPADQDDTDTDVETGAAESSPDETDTAPDTDADIGADTGAGTSAPEGDAPIQPETAEEDKDKVAQPDSAPEEPVSANAAKTSEDKDTPADGTDSKAALTDTDTSTDTSDAADDTNKSPSDEAPVADDPLTMPAGFGARRLHATPPETAGELVRTRRSRLDLGGATTDTSDDAAASYDVSRVAKDLPESTRRQPRFGRNAAKQGAEKPPVTSGDQTPLRPKAAGPAPDLPPLTRTKLQAQRGAARTPSAPVLRPEPPTPASPTVSDTPVAPPAPSIRERLSGMRKRGAKPAPKKSHAAEPPKQINTPPPPPADPQKPTGSRGLGGRLRSLGHRPADSAKAQGTRQEIAAAIAAPDIIAPPPATVRPRFSAPKKRQRATPAATVTDTDSPLTSGLLARGSIANKRGPSLRAGLILTLILLAVLGLIAIWAAFYLPETALARRIGLGSEPEITVQDDGEPAASDVPVLTIATPQSDDDPTPLASLTPDVTPSFLPVRRPQTDAQSPETDAQLPDIDADLDLAPLPEPVPFVDPETLLPSREENANFYARTGIWQRPPVISQPEIVIDLDGILLASLDPTIDAHDAFALPVPNIRASGDLPRRQSNPVSPDTEFVFGENGLVVPTAEGALNPDGILVFAGPPPFTPPQRPRDAIAVAAAADAPGDDPAIGAIDAALLGTYRPTERPGDLQEQRERHVLGGISYAELSGIRPTGRPLSVQELAAEEAADQADTARSIAEASGSDATVAEITSTSEMAVAVSFIPPTRPGNIEALVEAARAAGNSGPVAAVAANQADTVQPDIPSSASVTRAATQEDAINLRRINLIGVSGAPSNRRALVRLPSGRFVTVEAGDRLDGGRVAAISEHALQYVKTGRTITLEVPAG